MARVRVNGAWLIENSKIKEGLANAFHSLLSKPRDYET